MSMDIKRKNPPPMPMLTAMDTPTIMVIAMATTATTATVQTVS